MRASMIADLNREKYDSLDKFFEAYVLQIDDTNQKMEQLKLLRRRIQGFSLPATRASEEDVGHAQFLGEEDVWNAEQEAQGESNSEHNSSDSEEKLNAISSQRQHRYSFRDDGNKYK